MNSDSFRGEWTPEYPSNQDREQQEDGGRWWEAYHVFPISRGDQCKCLPMPFEFLTYAIVGGAWEEPYIKILACSYGSVFSSSQGWSTFPSLWCSSGRCKHIYDDFVSNHQKALRVELRPPRGARAPTGKFQLALPDVCTPRFWFTWLPHIRESQPRQRSKLIHKYSFYRICFSAWVGIKDTGVAFLTAVQTSSACYSTMVHGCWWLCSNLRENSQYPQS